MKTPLPGRRLLPGRRTPQLLLRREVELLSLDVFGVALKRLVFHPHDVHRLVGSTVSRHDPALGATYLGLRLRAEELARHAAADGGRAEISMADVGDHLAGLLAAGGRHRRLARQAIARELDVEQLVARPNPTARVLYDEARRRGIAVAFVADSYLPRDFVAKLLQDARYRSDLVLVSSHEGLTKASGELFAALAQRSGVAPDRIVHLGPDRHADVSAAVETGILGRLAADPRAGAETSLQLGLTSRTGLDSLALAMAADRWAEAGPGVEPFDIGYYAGGPLAAGFATWVGQLIDDQRPDRVIFCGRAGGLLAQLVAVLSPDAPRSRLHHLDPGLLSTPTAGWDDTSIDGLDRFVTSLGLGAEERLLAVDVGWSPQPHTWLSEGLGLLGRPNRVGTALIGLVDPPRHGGPLHLWAFGADQAAPLVELARARIEVLDALLPGVEALGGLRSVGATDEISAQLAAGIHAFADDLKPWLKLGQRQVTAALIEPALRIMHSPTYAEAELLGSFPTRSGQRGGPAVPLASLPTRGSLARDPRLLHRAALDAPWPQAFRVLAAGDPSTPSARLARRVVRRRGAYHQAM